MLKRGTIFIGWLVLASIQAVMAEDDLFPTYRDDSFEEKERLGVISLTSTAANYTINLTGVLLLGLSLAAAVTLWAYLNTFFAKGAKGYGDYGHGGGSSYKRSVDDPLAIVPVVLSNMHQRFQDSAIEDMPCRQRIICEISHADQEHPYNTFGHAVNTFFTQVEGDQKLVELVQSDKRGKFYYDSWKQGKGKKSCKAIYDKCSLTQSKIADVLSSN